MYRKNKNPFHKEKRTNGRMLGRWGMVSLGLDGRFGLKAENCVLEGRQERKVGQEGALRPTRPLGSVDRSSAWYDPHYRRAGLLRNAFAANWPNSAAVDEGASPASAAQIGQQTSGLCDAVPATRSSASRVGSGPARARREWQQTPQLNIESAPAASVSDPSLRTGLLDP